MNINILENSKIISIDNGKEGIQAAIFVQCSDGKKYVITATPSRRFIFSELLKDIAYKE